MNKNRLIVTTKRPKGEDGYRTFSIRIREEIVKDLDGICQKTGRKRNELIGIFLAYAVENCEIEETKNPS